MQFPSLSLSRSLSRALSRFSLSLTLCLHCNVNTVCCGHYHPPFILGPIVINNNHPPSPHATRLPGKWLLGWRPIYICMYVCMTSCLPAVFLKSKSAHISTYTACAEKHYTHMHADPGQERAQQEMKKPVAPFWEDDEQVAQTR